MCGVNFWKILINEDLDFDIFEKGQILRPFFRPSTLKNANFSKYFNGSICVYIIFYLPIFRGGRWEKAWSEIVLSGEARTGTAKQTTLENKLPLILLVVV